MHVLQVYFCLEKIIGLDEKLVSVDDIKSIKLSLDSVVLDNITLIPSCYAKVILITLDGNTFETKDYENLGMMKLILLNVFDT